MFGFKAVLHLMLLCQVIQQITAECPMIKCREECFKGFDSDGCTICNCDNTCQVTKCPDGQKCVMTDVTCIMAPCDQQPQCVPNDEPKPCPAPIQCKEPCVADIGEDGCYSKCACPKTCRDIKCKRNEECELVQIFCIRAPCFPIPTCFPKNRTCGQSPNVQRCTNGKRVNTRWTYNSGTNACESFRYYGCIPSPNTFTSSKQCTDTCVQVPSCPQIKEQCMENCYLGEKTLGACKECICPCQTVRCSSGEECRLNKEICSKGEPCRRPAYCDTVN